MINWVDEEATVPDLVWLMGIAEKHNIVAFPEDLQAFVLELARVDNRPIPRLENNDG